MVLFISYANRCTKAMMSGIKLSVLLVVILVNVTGLARNAFAGQATKQLPVVRSLLTNDGHGNKQLPLLKLANGDEVKVVSNCADFVKSIPSWDVREGINNMRVASDYQSCVARAIFAQAHPSRKTAFRKNFPKLIYRKLDLTSFPSSLHNRTEKTQWSISTLGMKVKKQSETSVIFSPAGWQYRFDLLAKGDFNRDGNEDLLVRFIDQATEGNYYAVKMLVLSKSIRKDIWSAQEGVSFLRTMNKTG